MKNQLNEKKTVLLRRTREKIEQKKHFVLTRSKIITQFSNQI